MLRGAPLLLLFRAGGGSEPPTPTAPSRQVYSAEDIAESESLLNTFEDKSTLTFTPDADSDYVIFWSCEIQSTNTGRAVEAELWDDTATARMQASLKRVERVGDYNSIQGFHIASFGASPVSQTYKIRWRGETVGSTYRIRNARLVALKLVDGDEWASNTVSATQLSNEILADHSSLTFTPATAGDYLLLGTGMYSRSGVASLVRMQLDVSGTPTRATEHSANSITAYGLWFNADKVSLTDSSQTCKIQFQANANGDTSYSARCFSSTILALRLDAWPSHHYVDDNTRTLADDPPDWTDKLTLTETLPNKQHLVIAAGYGDNDAVTRQWFGRTQQDGVDVAANATEPRTATLANDLHGVVYLTTPTAGSHTFEMQHTKATSIDTSGMQCAFMAVLQSEGT